MGDRCTGHCCREFTLPVSPEELWAMYGRWAEWVDTKVRPDGRIPTDIHLIAPMSRLTMVLKAGDPCPRQIGNVGDGDVFGEDLYFYTCVHLDESGDCGIYEHRPEMCSSYPNGKVCRYPGCTRTYKLEDGIDAVKKMPELKEILDDGSAHQD